MKGIRRPCHALFVLALCCSPILTTATTDDVRERASEPKKIDYTKSAPALVREIADETVPAIRKGMALVAPPPGGTTAAAPQQLVRGIFPGRWDVESNFLGKRTGSTPLVKVVRYVESVLRGWPPNLLKKPREEANIPTDDATAAKVKEYLAAAARDADADDDKKQRAACGKYAALSKKVSKALRNSSSSATGGKMADGETAAAAATHVRDCDAFLNRTEAAILTREKDVAVVLWFPSVVTTLTRAALLTEVASNGPALLGLQPSVAAESRNELETAVRKHFDLYNEYNARRLYSVVRVSSQTLGVFGNFTAEEYDTCRLQGQLLYLDRRVYPHGVPRRTVLGYRETGTHHVDLAKAATAATTNNSDGTRHAQIFYDGMKDEVINKIMLKGRSIVNCFMGPVLPYLLNERFSVRVTFAAGRSYQMRVVYLHGTVERGLRVKEGQTGNTNYNLLENYSEDVTDDGAQKTARVERWEPSSSYDCDVTIKDAEEGAAAAVARFAYFATYYATECRLMELLYGQFITGAEVKFAKQNCRVMSSYHVGKFVVETPKPAFVVPKKADGKFTVKIQPEDDLILPASVLFVALEFVSSPAKSV